MKRPTHVLFFSVFIVLIVFAFGCENDPVTDADADTTDDAEGDSDVDFSPDSDVEEEDDSDIEPDGDEQTDADSDDDSDTPEAVDVLFVVSNHGTIGEGKRERETGVWFGEVTHPYWELMDSSIGDRVVIDIASPDGGDAPIDAYSVIFSIETFQPTGDELNERFLDDESTRDFVVSEQVGTDDKGNPIFSYRFVDTLTLGDVDLSPYEAIFYAGGNGAIFQFPDDPDVQQSAQIFYESDRLVTAVCHGGGALLNVTLSDDSFLVSGMDVTGFTRAEEEALGQLEDVPIILNDAFADRGANFIDGGAWALNVVVEDRLITGQNPVSAQGVGQAIAEYFASE